MKDMNIHGHVVFKKGDKIFSVNRLQSGYIISPLVESDIEYIAVRYDDRKVFLYRVPDDIPDNIYPFHIYEALCEKHMVISKAPLIKSRYDTQKLFIRIDSVSYDYSGTVKIDPPMPSTPTKKAANCRRSLENVDPAILDIFEEAQGFTGKSDLHLEMYSPVSDYLDYVSDMN